MSREAMMTADHMCENVIKAIDETFKSFNKRPAFDFIKVEDRARNYVEHKLIY